MKTTRPQTPLCQPITAILLRLWVLLFVCASPVHALEPESRITIAVLPLEDQTKDAHEAHWRHSLPRMISRPLDSIPQVRIYAADATEYGLRRCKLSPGEAINAEQAKTIGEIIEVRRVIWGNYRREGKNWVVTVHIMSVAEGASSSPITVTSDDWFTLTLELAEKILAELKVSPTDDQKQKMQIRMTNSAEALECYSRCYALMTDRRPFAEVAQMAEKAIKLDHKFADAYLAYGSCLLSQGKFPEGRVQIEKALALKPNNDRALMALGVLCGIQNNLTDAAKYLQSAAQFGPDEPENFVRLAEFHLMMKEYDKAVAQLGIAMKLNPVSASANAQLGFCYALMAKKELAVSAMQNAVMIDPIDTGVCQMVAQGYDRLGMTSQAIEYREKFLVSAKKSGLNPTMMKAYEERLEELRSSLKTQYVSGTEPRRYTAEQLRSELRERLTPEEFSQLLYPLDATPAMKQWAQEITKGAKDDREKARALYDALAQHLSPAAGGARTARQVFEDWKKPDTSFQCQEYARLYVALAREVGLNAYFARVDQDHNDQVILHACGAVFLSGKIILVDVSYRWFGITHKKFTINNDYEALVMQMNQSDGLASKRIAVKLQPDDLSLFNLAGVLLSENETAEAKTVIERYLQLETETWMKHFARGCLAWMEKDLDSAEKELRQSIEIYSGESSAHFHLGQILLHKQDLAGALEAFRSCIQQRPSPAREMKCRRYIALIHENLAEPSLTTSQILKEKWREQWLLETQCEFSFFEWSPEIVPAIGLIYDSRTEALEVEIEALRRQSEKEPQNAVCRFRMGFLLRYAMRTKEGDIAMEDAQRVARSIIQQRPMDLDAIHVLVCSLQGNEEAGTLAKKAVETVPGDWRSWMCLAHHQSYVFLRALFQGVENLPAQGYDVKRAEEAISLRSGSPSECLKLIKMINECYATATKAVELSKDSGQALVYLLGVRSTLGGYLRALQNSASVSEDETASTIKTNLQMLARAAQASQDKPEVLAAISLIQLTWVSSLARSEQGVHYEPAAAHKKALGVIEPNMKRLLTLAEQKDSALAAVAYEGYAEILLSQKGAGISVELPANFAERLDQAVTAAPQRIMLWDLRITHEALKKSFNQAHVMVCHELALKRIKLFPTARGYAILASTAPVGSDELIYWEKAASMEPDNLFYALNGIASKMCTDSSEDGLTGALTRLQEMGDIGYENGYWEQNPQHNLYRMRLFVIQQALAGKPDSSRRALDQLMRNNPDDAQVQRMSELLNNQPE